MFDFARGHPHASLLPVQELQQLMKMTSEASASALVQNSLKYGCEEGEPNFLQELAAFQERHTQDDDIGVVQQQQETTKCSGYNQFFMTEGVSHGIELLCATQLQAGDVVLVERPTYFLVGNIFHSHRLNVQSLPMTTTSAVGGGGGGIDVKRLAMVLDLGEMIPVPKMIYIIPVHQNPTAQTMSIEDRHELAALAMKHEIIIVADEVYHLLDWRDSLPNGGRRPARMAAVGQSQNNRDASQSNISDRRGCCVSVSAFTKIFAPGIRCGWIEGPAHIIKPLQTYGYIRSQGGCSPVVGELMRCAMSERIADQVLSKLNKAYCRRSQTLCQALLRAEPRIQIVHPPLGGYFVWLQFPPETGSAAEFLTFCCEAGVKFLPGVKCDPFHGDTGDEAYSGLPADAFSLYARFCFADMDEQLLEEGAAMFARCFQQFLQDRSNDIETAGWSSLRDLANAIETRTPQTNGLPSKGLFD